MKKCIAQALLGFPVFLTLSALSSVPNNWKYSLSFGITAAMISGAWVKFMSD